MDSKSIPGDFCGNASKSQSQRDEIMKQIVAILFGLGRVGDHPRGTPKTNAAGFESCNRLLSIRSKTEELSQSLLLG
jgi:hypothetical protein